MVKCKFRMADGRVVEVQAADYFKAVMKVCDMVGITPISAFEEKPKKSNVVQIKSRVKEEL